MLGLTLSPAALPANPPIMPPATRPTAAPAGPPTAPIAAPVAPPAAAPTPAPTGCAPGAPVIGSRLAGSTSLVCFFRRLIPSFFISVSSFHELLPGVSGQKWGDLRGRTNQE